MVDQVSISSSDKEKNKAIIIKSVLADVAFDTNRNFRYLEEKGIKPGIKVRKNSVVSSTRNNRLRNQEGSYGADRQMIYRSGRQKESTVTGGFLRLFSQL